MNIAACAKALGGEVRGNRVHCPGPGHSIVDRSMWVTFDWQAPDGFVVGSFAGDPFNDCRDYVRAKLGMTPWAGKSEPIPPAHSRTTITSGNNHSGRTRHAVDLWGSAAPIQGTPAEAYLVHRIGREIDWPLDLRYLPRCARKIAENIEYHPALIALLRDIDIDEPRAIQRIFLKPDGSDRLRDAMGKATLGPSMGCVCKLSSDADVTVGLGITEGAEKGLSLLALGWAPIWATCGTSGMASFPALSGIETLTIFADNDMPGKEASEKCAKRWTDTDAAVRVALPKKADWSDELAVAA